MNNRTQARIATAVAAFALAVGLAGCSTLPQQATSASTGAACLNLRSTVTNLEALRAWCLDHPDAAGAAGWVSGIANSLSPANAADAATSSRIRDAAARLQEQVKLLAGSDGETAVAELPDVLTGVIHDLAPARDAVCA